MATRSPFLMPCFLRTLANLQTSKWSCVRDRAGVAGVALEDDGGLVALAGLDVPVEAVVGRVQLAAREPLDVRGRVEAPTRGPCPTPWSRSEHPGRARPSSPRGRRRNACTSPRTRLDAESRRPWRTRATAGISFLSSATLSTSYEPFTARCPTGSRAHARGWARGARPRTGGVPGFRSVGPTSKAITVIVPMCALRSWIPRGGPDDGNVRRAPWGEIVVPDLAHRKQHLRQFHQLGERQGRSLAGGRVVVGRGPRRRGGREGGLGGLRAGQVVGDVGFEPTASRV